MNEPNNARRRLTFTPLSYRCRCESPMSRFKPSPACSAPTADAVVQPCAPKPPSSVRLVWKPSPPGGSWIGAVSFGGSTGGGGGGEIRRRRSAAHVTGPPRRPRMAPPRPHSSRGAPSKHPSPSHLTPGRHASRRGTSPRRASKREDTVPRERVEVARELVEDAHVGARRELEHQLQARLLARRAEARSPTLLHMQQRHEALCALLEGVVLVSFQSFAEGRRL